MCHVQPIDQRKQEREAFDEATLAMLEALLKNVQRIAKCRGEVHLTKPVDLTRLKECWEGAGACTAELTYHVLEALRELGLEP